MTLIERSLPFNIEAEQAVLGSLLINPESIAQIINFLSSEDFYREAHCIIYTAIVSLHNNHIPADILTLTDFLEGEQKLDQAGKTSYLLSLVNIVPTSGNIAFYAQIVLRTAVRRRLIGIGSEIVTIAFQDDAEDIGVVLDRAEHLMFEVTRQHRTSPSSSAHIGELIARYANLVEDLHLHHKSGLLGIATGFQDLDFMLKGFQRSDCLILAARPAVGKTSLALNIAYNVGISHRNNVGIFSLEMSKDQLTKRLLSIASGVDQQRINTGSFDHEEWERIVKAMGEVSEAGIWIDDTPGLSLMQLRSKARQWVLEHKIDFIIIDYLQLIHMTSDDKRYDNRVNEVGAISRGLKELARELNIPVLVLAQLSRAVETRQSKVPMLSDLRESGSIEADADIVMFIYRDDVYNMESERPNTADIIIAKHRNGPVGQITLYFDKHLTRFRDFQDWDEAQQLVDSIQRSNKQQYSEDLDAYDENEMYE